MVLYQFTMFKIEIVSPKLSIVKRILMARQYTQPVWNFLNTNYLHIGKVTGTPRSRVKARPLQVKNIGTQSFWNFFHLVFDN